MDIDILEPHSTATVGKTVKIYRFIKPWNFTGGKGKYISLSGHSVKARVVVQSHNQFMLEPLTPLIVCGNRLPQLVVDESCLKRFRRSTVLNIIFDSFQLIKALRS
jgi:hypothetical protein